MKYLHLKETLWPQTVLVKCQTILQSWKKKQWGKKGKAFPIIFGHYTLKTPTESQSQVDSI